MLAVYPIQIARREQVKRRFAFDAVPPQRPFEWLFVIRRGWRGHQNAWFVAGFRQPSEAR